MPHVNPRAPFTEKDAVLLEQAEEIIGDLVEKFDRAEACGQDCKALKRTKEEVTRQLALIRENFFTAEVGSGHRV